MQSASGSLSIKSLNSLILWGVASLTILLIVIRPEATAGFGIGLRSTYWISHLAAGTLAAYAVIFLTKYLGRLGSCSKPQSFVIIFITGVIGALISSPLFCVLELIFPDSADVDPVIFPDLPVYLSMYLSELFEAGPAFIAIWFCINLPILLSNPVLTLAQEEPEPEDLDTNLDEKDRLDRIEKLEAFKANLPFEIGDEVIAISSDLHYLNVYTKKGKALVLGSLKHVASLFDDEGMQVHRSHWVNKHHVQKLINRDGTTFCSMDNGLELPVSRSKRKAVKETFSILNKKTLRQSDLKNISLV